MNSQVQASQSIPCINPATGEAIGEVKINQPDEVQAIVQRRARTAQKAG